MNKLTALLIIICVILIVSLGLNIFQYILYDNNMQAYHEQYMDLMHYCEQLEEIVEEWEVWIP